ncbi:helix-turn-helix transcriptional regulator [Methylomonas sp. ZR1]|uniref:helix-turn-helix domain-containing protein n=1 Tax=Methylomonas sp. ZR1 TaxID=1797072 RepID=UPI001492E17B|nr:helix-turn-helix transcriptional regulator [Methylomonas sp. ZR1]NOV29203.1 XRE family transcriptional regulator [Methylomonas sp. ZR1]
MVEQTEALQRLKQAVADSNITQVADKIGVKRCTLSLVVNDKYPANPKKILEKFETAYGGVECPHLAQTLTHEQCRDYATKRRPSNPLGLQHWRACQNCIHKGAKP